MWPRATTSCGRHWIPYAAPTWRNLYPHSSTSMPRNWASLPPQKRSCSMKSEAGLKLWISINQRSQAAERCSLWKTHLLAFPRVTHHTFERNGLRPPMKPTTPALNKLCGPTSFDLPIGIFLVPVQFSSILSFSLFCDTPDANISVNFNYSSPLFYQHLRKYFSILRHLDEMIFNPNKKFPASAEWLEHYALFLHRLVMVIVCWRLWRERDDTFLLIAGNAKRDFPDYQRRNLAEKCSGIASLVAIDWKDDIILLQSGFGEHWASRSLKH